MIDHENNTSARTFSTVLGVGLFVLPLAYPPWGGSFLPLKRMGLFVLVAALAIAAFKVRHLRWTTAPAMLFAVAYPGIALLSTAWAVNPFTSATESAQLVVLAALFVLCLHTLDLDGFVRATRWAAGAGALVAVLGIFEYFALDLTILNALGLETLRIPSAGRPSATFAFRNITASFLVGCIPMVGIAWYSESRSNYRHGLALSGSLMLLLLVYTRTRGAWLGLAFSGVVAAAYLYRNNFRPNRPLSSTGWSGIVGALALAFLATLNPIDENSPQKFDVVKETPAATLGSVVDPSADRGRLTFWKHTVDMALGHPLLGVGYENWEYHYPVYDAGEWTQAYAEPVRPHNDVLWVWSELGPIGLIAFLAFIGIPIYASFARRDRSRREIIVNAGCLATISALFVHGCFSFLREQPVASLFLWFSIIGLSLSQRRTSGRRVSWLAQAVVVIGLLGAWIGLAHVRFDHGYHIAKTQYDSGEFDRALLTIQATTEEGPFDHRAAFLKGRILQTLGRNEDAAAAYRVALDQHPNYANTHHNLAGALTAMGDVEGALPHFHRALEIRPVYHEARINLANTLVRSGDIASAKRQVGYVIEQNDRIPKAYGLLGAILLHEGDARSSVAALERAIQLDPEFVDAYNNLAVAYEHAGRPDAALATWRALSQRWKRDPRYLDSIKAEIRRLEESKP